MEPYDRNWAVIIHIIWERSQRYLRWQGFSAVYWAKKQRCIESWQGEQELWFDSQLLHSFDSPTLHALRDIGCSQINRAGTACFHLPSSKAFFFRKLYLTSAFHGDNSSGTECCLRRQQCAPFSSVYCCVKRQHTAPPVMQNQLTPALLFSKTCSGIPELLFAVLSLLAKRQTWRAQF